MHHLNNILLGKSTESPNTSHFFFPKLTHNEELKTHKAWIFQFLLKNIKLKFSLQMKDYTFQSLYAHGCKPENIIDNFLFFAFGLDAYLKQLA